MIADADDQVRLVGGFGWRFLHQPSKAVARHAEAGFYFIEDAEIVVVNHPVDVALIAKLRRSRQQHDAQHRGNYEPGDQHPDGLAAVRKDLVYSHCVTPSPLNFDPREEGASSIEVYLHTGL